MPDPKLLDYIKQKLELGLTQENVRTILVTNGWKEAEVTEALTMIEKGIVPPPSKPSKQYTSIKKEAASGMTWLVWIVIIVLLIAGAFGWYFGKISL